MRVHVHCSARRVSTLSWGELCVCVIYRFDCSGYLFLLRLLVRKNNCFWSRCRGNGIPKILFEKGIWKCALYPHTLCVLMGYYTLSMSKWRVLRSSGWKLQTPIRYCWWDWRKSHDFCARQLFMCCAEIWYLFPTFTFSYLQSFKCFENWKKWVHWLYIFDFNFKLSFSFEKYEEWLLKQ